VTHRTNSVIAVRRGEGEALWMFGCLTTIRAEHENIGAVVEHKCPRAMATPVHVQPDDYEAFYVLEGEITVFAEGKSTTLTPGSYVYVPPGTPHAWRVESDEATVLNLTTNQHANWFRALGQPALQPTLPPPAPPDMDRVLAVSDTYNVQIVGPPPD